MTRIKVWIRENMLTKTLQEKKNISCIQTMSCFQKEADFMLHIKIYLMSLSGFSLERY